MAFHFLNCPPHWKDLVTTFDTYGSTGCTIKERTNLLVQSIEQTSNPTVFHGLVEVAPGISFHGLMSSQLDFDASQTLDSFRFLWDVRQSLPTTKFWLLDVIDDVSTNQTDFCIDSDTIILPFPPRADGQLRCLELFSGGYGGWHFAMDIIKQHCGFGFRVVALDSDLEACRTYALTHEAKLISGNRKLPSDMLDQFSEHCVIHADITSRVWLSPVVRWRPHLVFVSAPCPPWSTAGLHKGLQCHEGLLFPEAILICKWLQPQMILVEQVSGFAHHHDKHWILKTFNAAGYRLVWAKTIDIRGVCPTFRSRWLALLAHSSENLNSTIAFETWQTNECPSPEAFDAVFPEDLAFDSRLKPDAFARSILANKDFLPPSKRAKFSGSFTLDGDAFSERAFPPNQTTPTFMASYSKQHCFDEGYLRSAGCLTHLLKTPTCDGRYWHPAEVFMLHLGIRQFYIDHNWTRAYRFLGNQIAIPHAILLITNALRILRKIPPSVQVEQIIQCAKDSRVTVDNMILYQGHNGLFIAHKDFVPQGSTLASQAAVAQLHSFGPTFLPDNTFWDFEGIQPLSNLLHCPNVSIECEDRCETTDPLTQVTIAEASGDISPTMPFVSNQLAVLHLPSHDEHYWVASDVNPQQLCQLWDGWVQVNVDSSLGIFHLIPSPQQSFLEGECQLAVVNAGNRFHICNFTPKDEAMQQVKSLVDHCPTFDQFGSVNQGEYQCCTPFFDQAPLVYGDTDIDAIFLVAAFVQVRVHQKVDMLNHALAYTVTGPSCAVQAVLQLFRDACGTETLKRFHRAATVEGDTVTFVPTKSHEALPIAPFRIALVVAITRSLVNRLAQEPTCQIQVKWLGRPLVDSSCPDNLAISVIETVITVGLTALEEHDRISLVHKGQKVSSQTVLSQLAIAQHSNKILLHVVRPFSGGGPGSKQTQRIQIKNSLAGSLLERGVDLQWITSNVDKVVDKIGIQKLAPIAALRQGEQRDQQILQAFADCDCPVPPKSSKVLGSSAFQQRTKRRAVTAPLPTDLAIDCDFILKADGSPTQQISEFRGQRTGVYLTNVDQALPWIRENQVLSADELGMIVIGELTIVCQLPHQSILIPCKDGSNRDILLAATLIQFGTKQLVIKDLDKHKIKNPQCQVTALTLWKSEWSNEEWTAATGNTMQFIRDAFSFDGMQDAIVTTWGRSLRKGRQVANPGDATSIQVHASIRADSFLAFLGKSGFNKIWAAPKKEDGRLSDDFRVIWFEGDIQRATSLSATLSGASGLIQGKNSFGLRFTLSSFSSAWKHIHPGQDEPDHIVSKWVYKIEPLPFGCSPDQIREWSQHIQWKCRPLKATGARAWIVTSDTEPPATTVAFNGQPLLIRLLPQKGSPTVAPIVAGPRTPKTFQDTTSQPALLQTDPWAQYKGIRQPPIPPAPQPRSVAGPSETRLQQQDDKIDAIEKQIQQLAQHQEKQSTQIDDIQKDIQQSEHRIADQVRQSIGEVRNELAHSVRDAMNQQSKQFEDNMKDLRLLFQQANPKRKNDQVDMEP